MEGWDGRNGKKLQGQTQPFHYDPFSFFTLTHFFFFTLIHFFYHFLAKKTLKPAEYKIMLHTIGNGKKAKIEGITIKESHGPTHSDIRSLFTWSQNFKLHKLEQLLFTGSLEKDRISPSQKNQKRSDQQCGQTQAEVVSL